MSSATILNDERFRSLLDMRATQPGLDLLLLGELDDKVVFGSMNRGGLTGSAWELDDRFTAYDAAAMERLGLDGGKMLVRILDEDQGTIETLHGCATAVTELAERQVVAMVEPLPAFRDTEGRVRISDDVDELVAAIGVASSLGSTSAYTWLKLPAPSDRETMMAATTLPALLICTDPDHEWLLEAWSTMDVDPRLPMTKEDAT